MGAFSLYRQSLYRQTLFLFFVLVTTVLCWLALHFWDSSLVYYYWLLGFFDSFDTGINIVAFIGCLTPLFYFVFSTSTFALDYFTHSRYALVRTNKLNDSLSYIVGSLALQTLLYIVYEFCLTFGLDLARNVAPPVTTEVMLLLFFSIAIRYICVCCLLLINNLITLHFNNGLLAIPPLSVYGISLATFAFVKNFPLILFLPWYQLVQDIGFTSDVSEFSFNIKSLIHATTGFGIVGLILLALIVLFALQIQKKDFL